MSATGLQPLRYPATCVSCGATLAPKTRAIWDKEQRTATCEPCATAATPPPERAPIDRGLPGASAAREGQRRSQRREHEIRAAHPRIGGLILALTDEPQSTQAWHRGAIGERALGESLDRLREDGLGVLHDRRIPGTRANIDHLVIGPAGVFVIDAKRYRGKVQRRDRDSIFSRDWRLYVNRRDRTALVGGMKPQVAAVRAALAAARCDCPVIPVLCFIDSEWDFVAVPFAFDDVRVVWPKLLYKLVRSEGPLTRNERSELERDLALHLPPAHQA